MYGAMINHPPAWPFYCNDIDQLALTSGVNRRKFPTQEGGLHNALADARWTRDTYYWILKQGANGG